MAVLCPVTKTKICYIECLDCDEKRNCNLHIYNGAKNNDRKTDPGKDQNSEDKTKKWDLS